MTFWTLATLKSFKQDLMGFGATSQLPCLCLSTRAGESQFTSSREVITIAVHYQMEVIYIFLSLLIISIYQYHSGGLNDQK